MKRILIVVFATIAFVIPVSAQWVKTEKQNLITGKNEVTFVLQSHNSEKAKLTVWCDGGANPVENNGGAVQLLPGFQVNRSNGNYSQVFHEFLIWVPTRLDDKAERDVAALRGDLDNILAFNRKHSEKIVTSKEVVLEAPEFAGPVHQMLFKMDEPPLPLDKKGRMLCPIAAVPVAAPAVPATAPRPAEAANVETVSAVQSQPTTAAAAVMPATAPPPAEGARPETVSAVQPQPTGGESLGDAAKRNKQHKACLELAKDNPSIICK